METRKPTPEEIAARIETAKREAEVAMRTTRNELLERLRTAKIGKVEAQYDGYGDSGGVNQITGGMEDRLEEAVSSFVWDFAYGRHPGFENGEGGQGTLNWDITTDRITLDHGDNYIEVEQTREEDL